MCVNMFFGVNILIYDNVLFLKRSKNVQNAVHVPSSVKTIYYVFSTVYNNGAV